MNDLIPSKPCSKCGVVKPIETGFYPSKIFKSGFTAQCRECIKSTSRKWAADNPEKRQEKDASRYQKYLAEREPVPCSCGCGLMTKGKSAGLPFYRGHGIRGKPNPLLRKEPGFPEAVIVDDDIRESLGQYRWSINGDGYVQRHEPLGDGRHTKVMLHRAVLDFPAHALVDHINGNRLDNRRANLRVVNDQENAQNRATKQSSSGRRGVSWNKAMGKWYAHAKIDGRMISLGFYDDLEEAACAAKDFRQKHYTGFIDR